MADIASIQHDTNPNQVSFRSDKNKFKERNPNVIAQNI